MAFRNLFTPLAVIVPPLAFLLSHFLGRVFDGHILLNFIVFSAWTCVFLSLVFQFKSGPSREPVAGNRPIISRRQILALAAVISVTVLCWNKARNEPPAPYFRPIAFNQPLFVQAVTWAIAHRAGDTVVLKLPPGLSKVSVTGRLYFTAVDQGTNDVLIFAPAWVGPSREFPETDNWIEGYCYLRGNSKLFDKKLSGTSQFLFMAVPSGDVLATARNDSDWGAPEMFVDHRVTGNWYAVDSFS